MFRHCTRSDSRLTRLQHGLGCWEIAFVGACVTDDFNGTFVISWWQDGSVAPHSLNCFYLMPFGYNWQWRAEKRNLFMFSALTELTLQIFRLIVPAKWGHSGWPLQLWGRVHGFNVCGGGGFRWGGYLCCWLMNHVVQSLHRDRNMQRVYVCSPVNSFSVNPGLSGVHAA